MVLHVPSLPDTSPSPAAHPVSARAIAEHILWMRGDSSTSQAQLEKLVYLCHGWMLGFRDQPLINDEVVVAETGPVVQGLAEIRPKQHAELDVGQREIISMVIDGYGGFTAQKLSALTHEEGTPWYSLRHRQGEKIQIEELKEHYRELIACAEREMAPGR